MKEGKMPLTMKHIVWLKLGRQWRYLTDKTGFLFSGTHGTMALRCFFFVFQMIEQLSHQVHELESERRKTDVKVQDLEHQVHTMTTRLTDYRGQYEVNLPQIYSVSQKKTEPWNNGMLRASFRVYDYYHIYSSLGRQDLVTQFLVKITFLYKLVAKKLDFVLSKFQISIWKDRATVAW